MESKSIANVWCYVYLDANGESERVRASKEVASIRSVYLSCLRDVPSPIYCHSLLIEPRHEVLSSGHCT